MPKSYTLIVVLCAGLALAAGAQAAAPSTAGQWIGGAVADQRGRFSHCAFEGPSFGSGTMLSIRMTRNYHLAIGIREPSWQLRLGPSFLSAYRIDDEEKVEGRSTAVARDTVVIAMRGSPRNAEAQLRRGRVLRVSVDDMELAFALDDSARALNKLNDCVATGRAGNR